MPIYTYRCANCGVQFEKTQKFSDQPLQWCPECGKKALNKVYQPVGIVFKGSGFYATDHRSPSGASRSSNSHSEGEGSKPAEPKTETKSDSSSTPAEKSGDKS
jgi:putative FmdB family regulatory protein